MTRMIKALTATVIAFAATTAAFEASAASIGDNGRVSSFSVTVTPNNPDTPNSPGDDRRFKPRRSCTATGTCGNGEIAKVCYYTQPNFQGASFCSKPGAGFEQLSSRWNDRISSIRIVGHARTKVCTDSSLTGKCILLGGGARSQLLSMDDAISSLVIYN